LFVANILILLMYYNYVFYYCPQLDDYILQDVVSYVILVILVIALVIRTSKCSIRFEPLQIVFVSHRVTKSPDVH
jgi:hypothetical protein